MSNKKLNDKPTDDKDVKTLLVREASSPIRVRELLCSDYDIPEEAYCYLIENLSNQVHREFRPKSNNKKGRYYTNDTSITYLKKDVRSYICQDDFIDIDIKACYPSIVFELSKQYGIQNKNLQNYLENYDKIVKDNPDLKSSVRNVIHGAIHHVLNREFADEINEIMDHILSSHQGNEEEKVDRGTKVHQILSRYERVIIDRIICYLKKKSIDIRGYCYDGLILPKEASQYLDELNEISKPYKIIIKPWNPPKVKITIPHDHFDWNDKSSYSTLESFNNGSFPTKGHFLKQFIPVVLKTIRNISGNYLIKYSNRTHKIGNLPNITVRVGSNHIKSHAVFSELNSLICFENVCNTDKPTNNCFSIWKGFGYKTVDLPYEQLEEECKPFINHIKEILCNGDINVYNHFIKWLAVQIQNVGIKTEVGYVFCGKGGIGKSTVGRLIDRMFGHWNIATLSGLDRLTRNFNAELEGKTMVWLEELKSAKEHDFICDLNQLKTLIDQPYIRIERKGKDPYTIDCTLNVIGFSNNNYCVPMTEGVSRRFVLQVSNDKYQENFTYFEKLQKDIENDHLVNCFGSYLKLINLEEFQVRILPKTQLKQELTSRWMNPIEKLIIIAWIKRGKTLSYISTNEFIGIAREYKIEKVTKDAMSGRSLGFELRQYLGSQHETLRKYKVDLDSNKHIKTTPEMIQILEEQIQELEGEVY